jgi:hypothetical protein
MSQNQNTKSGLFFGFIIFLGLGIATFYFGMNNYKMYKASKSWPSVKGTVTESRVAIRQTESDGKMINMYYPKVVYHYFVNDTSFTNNKISFGEYGTDKRKHANKVIGKYPVNSEVTVYYNPKNPQEAVLERKAGFGNYLTLGVGLAFILGGILLLFALIKKIISG